MERAIPHLPGDDLGVAKDGILGLTRGTIHFAVDCPIFVMGPTTQILQAPANPGSHTRNALCCATNNVALN